MLKVAVILFFIWLRNVSLIAYSLNVRVTNLKPAGEDVQNPSTPPLPSPSSANNASRAPPPLVVKQEYAEERLRLAGMQ
jgi:hypothetical protein